jgi:tetratricopeptide (TPR) repeat protein
VTRTQPTKQLDPLARMSPLKFQPVADSPPLSPETKQASKVTAITSTRTVTDIYLPSRSRTLSVNSQQSNAGSRIEVTAKLLRSISSRNTTGTIVLKSTTGSAPRHHNRSSPKFDYPENVSELKGALQRRQNYIGKTHPSIGSLWNRIGNVHFRQGARHDAVFSYRNALVCDPGSHYGAAYANLGTVYGSLGSLDLAIVASHKALRNYKVDCGSEGKLANTDAIANVYHQLGLCQSLQGHYQLASSFLERSLEIRRSVNGPRHATVAKAFDKLGHVHALLGDYQISIQYHEKAGEIFLAVGFSLIPTLQKIAQLHVLRRNYTDAAIALRQIFSLQKGAGSDFDVQAAYGTLQRRRHMYTWTHQANLAEQCHKESMRFREKYGETEFL